MTLSPNRNHLAAAALGILIASTACAPSTSSSPAPTMASTIIPPRAQPTAPAVPPTPAGRAATLCSPPSSTTPPARTWWLATTRRNIADLRSALESRNWEAELRTLMIAGQLIELDMGTHMRVLTVDDQLYAQVEVLDGNAKGKFGWLTDVFICYS